MAGGDSTQQSIRKVLGALKDSTTVGLAKVNSDYKELDVAIVKATNHDEEIAKEKHLRVIFHAVSAARPRADVLYCINALARRLAKTHNWAVALKTLIVIHRALREVDLTFREELMNYTRSRGRMFNLSHFKDDSSPNAWDYSAWVRSYALFLEERLECFCSLHYDVETECSKFSDLDTSDLLEHLGALQNLLFRLIGCQPEGAALFNNVIRYALAIVAGESFKLYAAINSGILNLVDKFFEMQRHEATRALVIYQKAGNQAEKLSEFYDICNDLDFGRDKKFVKIEQPPASFLEAMNEYVRDGPRPLTVRNEVDADKRLTHKPVCTIEHKRVEDDNDKQEAAPTPTEQAVASTVEAAVGAPVSDLLCLDDSGQSAIELEEKNALALAIVADDNLLDDANNPSQTNGAAGWELALVGAPSSINEAAVADSKLAGGLDKLTLDSLYDDALARRMNPNTGGYQMGQSAPNPFETARYPQDPFYASNTVAPPANVRMAAMAQQQAFMMQQQQQTVLCQDSMNPFGNPFGAAGAPSHPPPNQYTGLM